MIKFKRFCHFGRITQIDSTHCTQPKFNEKVERMRALSRDLSESATAFLATDDLDTYESACRGEEQGRADISRWCSVYCGGSKTVVKILKGIVRESGMHSEFETFDW